jgi:hypothetical protein
LSDLVGSLEGGFGGETGEVLLTPSSYYLYSKHHTPGGSMCVAESNLPILCHMYLFLDQSD